MMYLKTGGIRVLPIPLEKSDVNKNMVDTCLLDIEAITGIPKNVVLEVDDYADMVHIHDMYIGGRLTNKSIIDSINSLINEISKIFIEEGVQKPSLDDCCCDAITLVDREGNSNNASIEFFSNNRVYGGTFSLVNFEFTKISGSKKHYSTINNTSKHIYRIIKFISSISNNICEVGIYPVSDINLFSGKFSCKEVYVGIKRGASTLHEGSLKDEGSYSIAIFV